MDPKKPHGGLQRGGGKNYHQVWEMESPGTFLFELEKAGEALANLSAFTLSQ